MAFLQRVDTIQAPASPGQVTYTATNFGGLPKLIRLASNSHTTTNGAGFHAYLGIGAASSPSAQAACAFSSLNNSANSNVDRHTSDEDCLVVINDGTIVMQARLVSFAQSGNDGQFTLDWIVTSNGAQVNYVLLGGDTYEANVVHFNTPASAGGQNVPHGLAAAPTVLYGASIALPLSSGDPPVTGFNGLLSFGMSNITASRCVNIGARDNQIDSDTVRRWSTDLFSFYYPTGSLGRAALAGVDNTNVTLTWSDVNQECTAWLIAMRGVQAVIGDRTTRTSNGLDQITGVGFSPTFADFISPLSASTPETADDARMMLGSAGAGVSRAGVVVGVLDQDAQATTNARRLRATNLAIKIINHGGTAVLDAAVNTFDADGLTLTYNATDGNAYDFAYMLMAEGSGDPPDPPAANPWFFRNMILGRR